MRQPVLEASHVSRQFRGRQGFLGRETLVRAVDDVSFSLGAGESLGLVGESGCGKSTLGRMTCGLLGPSSGCIRLQGRELPLASHKSWAKGMVQMIFQDPASSLNPRMTATQSVAEPLLVTGRGEHKAMEEAAHMLERVGLPHMGDRYPHQFSGGQRQRIAIARALITTPAVVVCDEPVSALDASVQAQALNLLRELQEAQNPAYLFISHDLAVVGFMCPRILVMYLGQIVEEASRDNIFSNAAHPYTQALVAAMPAGEKSWAAQRPGLPPVISGELPSPLSPPPGCHFHPRCHVARPICSEERPPWKKLGENWFARCHFPGQSCQPDACTSH